MRVAHLPLTCLLLAMPLFARAGGYDKTTWEMPVSQVQKLYPGGTKQITQTGDVHYMVLRKVATLDALVGFVFEDGRLTFVSVSFTMPGTSLTLQQRYVGYTRPTNKEAKVLTSIVRPALESKYGKPTVDAAKMGSTASGFSADVQAVWTKDGTTLLLVAQPLSDGASTEVRVDYGPSSDKPDARDTKGL